MKKQKSKPTKKKRILIQKQTAINNTKQKKMRNKTKAQRLYLTNSQQKQQNITQKPYKLQILQINCELLQAQKKTQTT